MPPSWQFPEVCCAKLTLHDLTYSSDNFREGHWSQSSEICVGGEVAGIVKVYYFEKRPIRDQGPFLQEECTLINAIAERVGRIVERVQFSSQLKENQAVLEETNAALRRLLSQVEEEKETIRQSVRENTEKILMPTLYSLEHQVPKHQKRYLLQLRRDLEDITAPFTSQLSSAFASLTPVEIVICKLIRSGLSTDEIAKLRYVSPSTVMKQREKIRRKLGLQGTGNNLASYLLTFGTGKEGVMVGR